MTLLAWQSCNIFVLIVPIISCKVAVFTSSVGGLKIIKKQHDVAEILTSFSCQVYDYSLLYNFLIFPFNNISIPHEDAVEGDWWHFLTTQSLEA